MLAAIAVLGLIGGTLAFKAQRYFNAPPLLYATTTSPTGYCYFEPGFTTSNSGVPTTIIAFVGKTTATLGAGPYYFFNANLDKPVYCTEPVKAYILAGD